LQKHPTLKSLCGNKGVESELDMSSKMGGAGGTGGVIMPAAETIDNGALAKPDVSSNRTGAGHAGGGLQRICVAGGIELAV
jgi:hypothetical protein